MNTNKPEGIEPSRLAVLLLSLVLGAALGISPVVALYDPSAVYCDALGYSFTIKSTSGGETGYCILPDNQSVDSWQFLWGTVGQQYSYCTQKGYQLKTVNNSSTCSGVFSDSCAVCVFPDRSEVEMTQLMNLSFREPDFVMETPSCDDGACTLPLPRGGNPVPTKASAFAATAVAGIVCAVVLNIRIKK